MDESEGVGDGVDVDNDTHMTHVAARTGTGEEDEVARLQFAAADGSVAGILIARRSSDEHVVLALIDIAGKT